MQLVTIFNSLSIMEAEIVRSRLEVSQFHPVITHGLSALSNDGYSLATGGILVQVPDDEASEAKDFLDSINQQQSQSQQ
jgi:hypothetical protein